MERGSTEFLCRVLSLGSVVGSLFGGLMYVVIGRGVLDHMESSSDGIICGY